MTPELTVLALSALLLLIQLGWMAVRANLECGSGYFLSPRDRPPNKMPGTGTMRLKRAYENHIEGLLPFAAAVTVVTLADTGGALTAACAWAYLAARVLYVPAYFLGWAPWRSVFFAVGYLATGLMLIAALLGG
ncbi:hypothetical protein DKT77_17535 [Meridianimarinicoccus roseus]|uniref:MAPEG family protein n=1 Tax=Meridianimarinicoccus roseus TaxID=2072018 RepID=A0A2V2L857_9RHOB|nr:MAPEG family protein [Meridianimarinicoccus roseus]PWR01365.1 hypothetical protein DKT77_17535 [Meridianimarinicoccus roseus]